MLQTECWLGCRCGCCSVVQFLLCLFFCFSAYGMQHAAGFEVLRRLTRALSSRRLQTSSNSRRCKVHLPHSRNACVSVFWSAVDCVRAICIYAKHLAAPQSSQKSETATGQTHMLHSPLIYADCPPSLSDLLASAIRLHTSVHTLVWRNVYPARSVTALRLAARRLQLKLSMSPLDSRQADR